MATTTCCANRRLRVERQEVLFGDADPLLCRQGDALVLAGRGGSLARSGDGGVTWSQLADLGIARGAGWRGCSH